MSNPPNNSPRFSSLSYEKPSSRNHSSRTGNEMSTNRNNRPPPPYPAGYQPVTPSTFLWLNGKKK
ncbi:hypothetical protein EX30DRAFT_340874 [Ascodesmis nigricans]|uniref:Uncharacterized protein n=1 Tax=Ascodesmis nigricans TaxID=341454 RepID=A0A4S2MX44_9PEZI|nr:hypothetical protein EX30DRAFT_340874 [Ascodesmis nigricans]